MPCGKAGTDLTAISLSSLGSGKSSRRRLRGWINDDYQDDSDDREDGRGGCFGDLQSLVYWPNCSLFELNS
uniref:Uncharacterized protein n=1 Tax=Panagrellus redivivus TaxID=6233 RepID=A0A7E4V3W8_PANRE